MEVKKLLLAGSALLTLSGSTYAADQAENYWSAFETVVDPGNQNAGAPFCLMRTIYNDKRAIYIKYIKGTLGFFFQVAKPGWRGKYDIQMSIYLDSRLIVNSTGLGFEYRGEGMVSLVINEDKMNAFLEQFAKARYLWVYFNAPVAGWLDPGDEGTWRADMHSSDSAVSFFKNCVTKLNLKPSLQTPPPVAANIPPIYDSVPIFSDIQGTSVSVDVHPCRGFVLVERLPLVAALTLGHSRSLSQLFGPVINADFMRVFRVAGSPFNRATDF
jgi:hypothetical protein